MSHLLFRIGRSAAQHPWRVIAAWLAIAVTAFVLAGAVGGKTDETFRLPGAESQKAADAIQDRFPSETLFTSNVYFHSDEGLDNPRARAAIADSVERLAEMDEVVVVDDPFAQQASTLSEDGRTAYAVVGFEESSVPTSIFDQATDATAAARDAGLEVEFDGGIGYADTGGEPSSEAIALVVAVIILSVAFGSLVAMSFPIGVALIAILIGTSTITILSDWVSVPEIATIVALMMGLGVGIDYSLFVLTRYRQNLQGEMPVAVAVGRANATAGLAVLFAGVTVILAISGLQVSGIPMMTAIGYSSAIMVFTTMLAAVTLLPALLGLAGRHVDRLHIPFVKRRPADDPDSRSGRLAAVVVRRPVLLGGLATATLIVLAIPVFAMRLGFPDAGNDAPDTTTRQAYDLVAESYGPGTNGPFNIVVEADGTDDPEAAAAEVARAVAPDPGIVSVTPPVANEDGSLVVLTATPTTGPQEKATSTLLSRLRDDVIPGALDEREATVSVTGSTALIDDVSTQLQERMPWFLAAVIGLSFLVMVVLFRSVLVPLKAAVLNVLSVGAAYGVVVAVFQWGWGASLIGVEETVPIMPLAPMLMFAILFGLSMDYEVFLVTRIRERFLVHGDSEQAIVEGVRATGRVITSAALIMIAVFGAFILGTDVTTKMFGVGLSTAVLLDVTLVRMVLVPAALSLLGARAWWLPRWLEGLPAIDLESATHEGDELVRADAESVGARH